MIGIFEAIKFRPLIFVERSLSAPPPPPPPSPPPQPAQEQQREPYLSRVPKQNMTFSSSSYTPRPLPSFSPPAPLQTIPRRASSSSSSPRRAAPLCTAAPSPAPSPALSAALERWTLQPAARVAADALCASPPLLRARGLLPAAVCDGLVERQRAVGEESDLYLNARVNREVGGAGAGGVSKEAAGLIGRWGVAEEALGAGDGSGFRSAVDVARGGLFWTEVLGRVEEAVGLQGREPVFEEGLWVRPGRRTYVVRDVTMVRYGVGEGVSPHVDGKDLTVLVYLSGEGGEEGKVGGSTCFPEVGVCVPPRKGDALVYWSKKELLHYSERVLKGEKWIMQLLIDFRVREGVCVLVCEFCCC